MTMNPNPNYSCGSDFGGELIFEPSIMEFDLSEYLMLDDINIFESGNLNFNQEEDSPPQTQSFVVSTDKCLTDHGSTSGSSTATSRKSNIKGKNVQNEEKSKYKMEVGHRVAFRTKSEMEVMDDGFRWRKYGKKSVKSSPNPRNYYKCLISGCNVKKRVQRDINDSSYVITTYEGVHNHDCPDFVYYDHTMPMDLVPNVWTIQASSSDFSL